MTPCVRLERRAVHEASISEGDSDCSSANRGRPVGDGLPDGHHETRLSDKVRRHEAADVCLAVGIGMLESTQCVAVADPGPFVSTLLPRPFPNPCDGAPSSAAQEELNVRALGRLYKGVQPVRVTPQV